MQIAYREALKDQADKVTVAVKSNNFNTQAQAVWAAKTLEEKRELAITTMVNCFKYPSKAQKFRNDIMKATTGRRIDETVKNLVLYGSGDFVVR